MKHIFVIKDFFATYESAKRIIKNQIDVILKAAADIDITNIIIFVNDFTTDNYPQFADSIPVSIISTLVSGNKKSTAKQTFAGFHNAVINNISKYFSQKDTIIHIQDGTLDLTDIPSERGICKTRLGEMVKDVVYLMDLLDHPVWFNTASDKGNMKFGHYFTIIDILNLDNTCTFETIPNCFMYAGNTNLDWIIINGSKYREMKMPSLMMNSNYDYDFLSIKELVSKFANFEHGYYDTMFPTIPMEVGSYFRNEKFDRDLKQYNMTKYKDNLESYKKNLEKYKNLKPADINVVVSFLRETLLKKLSKEDKEKLRFFENRI